MFLFTRLFPILFFMIDIELNALISDIDELSFFLHYLLNVDFGVPEPAKVVCYQVQIVATVATD